MRRTLSRVLFVGILLALLSCSLASLQVRSLPEEHVRRAGWNLVRGSDFDKSTLIKVFFGLPQPRLREAEETLRRISDPRHPDYGQWMTQNELKKFFAAPESAAAVKRWLVEAGVESENIYDHLTGDVLKAFIPLSLCEKLFQVEMYRFVEPRSGRTIFRSLRRYTLPKEVEEHIELVSGISDFFPQRNRRSGRRQEGLAEVQGVVENQAPGTMIYRSVDSRGGGPAKATGYILCPDGAVASKNNTASHPCQKQLVDVMVEICPYDNTAMKTRVKPHDLKVRLNSLELWEVSFSVEIPTYTPQYLSVRLVFEGHDEAPWEKFPWVVVNTPSVLVQNLRENLGIPAGARVTNPNATQCVVEFEQQYYSDRDLQLFFQGMGLPSTGYVVDVIGPNDQSNPGGEAALDIEWIMGLAYGSPTTFWSIAANSTAEIDDILQWEYAVGNSTNPPLVNSLSYGMTEIHVDYYLGAGYMSRSDAEFMKLAMMGLTNIIADGDSGAPDEGLPPMSAVGCEPLHGDWPSNSQYVVAVGSTFITPYAEPYCYPDKFNIGTTTNCRYNPLGEVAVSVDAGMGWTTGGGFSNFTSTAWYQEAAVKNYLNNTVQPPPNYFNSSGRAYPDVATNGHNLMCVVGGEWLAIDGTSASAPIFAAVITLLNDALLNNNQPPLGFVNPLLYHLAQEQPQTFQDVTVGHNACGDQQLLLPVCCPYGYRAAPGFDTVTGWGSPSFTEMRRVLVH